MNAKYTLCETQITQLDHSNVRVLGEIKDVEIRLSSNPLVYLSQTVWLLTFLMLMGFLSRDWSQNLNDFFAADWLTLWLPKNGKANQIKIGRE